MVSRRRYSFQAWGFRVYWKVNASDCFETHHITVVAALNLAFFIFQQFSVLITSYMTSCMLYLNLYLCYSWLNKKVINYSWQDSIMDIWELIDRYLSMLQYVVSFKHKSFLLHMKSWYFYMVCMFYMGVTHESMWSGKI